MSVPGSRANSAHELRTPVAAALAQAQRLRHEAPPGPLRDRATRIEEALHALLRLSEKLLQLAKAESGGLLAETPQDVRGVITHVVDELRRTHPARLELSLPGEARIVSSIDPDALAILLRYLVENALKHGCPERPVEVIVSSDGELRVINGGAVVPELVLASPVPGRADGFAASVRLPA
ncbi:histidine kinase dimerization/phospho-acceptor domain-containing protein [Halomonas sp. H10-9-1]|uniref:sensor histidine kinase n=1 Tax=Halomonas sp. H10-9-1 TaxID=2950871 RepID=UPI0032DFBEB5